MLACLLIALAIVRPGEAAADVMYTVTCRLPAPAVRDTVVRAHAKLRACYEDGLRRNALLDGVVGTTFIVARDGSVPWAVDDGSDIGDPATVACVVRTFRAMRFSAPPEGGVIRVSYPIRFTRYGGGLRAVDIRAALASRIDRVRLCSIAAREKNPSVAGTYVIELDVDTDGLAHARDAGSDVGDAAASACAARALDRVEVARPWEAVSLRVRISLAAAGGV
jgi:hypothetical protein